MFFKDEEGKVFQLKEDRAAYLTDVREVPTRYCPATETERDAFKLARELVWDMVEDNLGLAYTMAKRFPYEWRDELVSEVGIPVLLKAVVNYKKDKGTFANYVCQWLRRKYYEWVVARRAEAPVEPLHERAAEVSMKHIDRDAVLYVMKGLPEYDRMLLSLYFWEGMSYDDIALVADVAKSTISRHMLAALKRCKGILHGRASTTGTP